MLEKHGIVENPSLVFLQVLQILNHSFSLPLSEVNGKNRDMGGREFWVSSAGAECDLQRLGVSVLVD